MDELTEVLSSTYNDMMQQDGFINAAKNAYSDYQQNQQGGHGQQNAGNNQAVSEPPLLVSKLWWTPLTCIDTAFQGR